MSEKYWCTNHGIYSPPFSSTACPACKATPEPPQGPREFAAPEPSTSSEYRALYAAYDRVVQERDHLRQALEQVVAQFGTLRGVSMDRAREALEGK